MLLVCATWFTRPLELESWEEKTVLRSPQLLPINCPDTKICKPQEANSSCSCPDNDICLQCVVSVVELPSRLACNSLSHSSCPTIFNFPSPPLQPTNASALLRQVNRLPTGLLLEPCSTFSSNTTISDCTQSCAIKPDCTAFYIVDNSEANCCLFTTFNLGSASSFPGVQFYEMRQCETCADGFYKRGRSCEPLAQLPTFVRQDAEQTPLGSQITVLLPESAPANTTIVNVEASAEDGFGPVTYQIAEFISDGADRTAWHDTVGIDSQGNLFLKAALSDHYSVIAVVYAEDNRTECAFAHSTGGVARSTGPCYATMLVYIRVVGFATCPSTIHVVAKYDNAAQENRAVVSAAISGPTVQDFDQFALWQEPIWENVTHCQRGNVSAFSCYDDRSQEYRWPALSIGRHPMAFRAISYVANVAVYCNFTIEVHRGVNLLLQDQALTISSREQVDTTYLTLLTASQTPSGGYLGSIPDWPDTNASNTFAVVVSTDEGSPLTITVGAEVQDELSNCE